MLLASSSLTTIVTTAIAALAGLTAALLSYLMARRQVSVMQRESEAGREHAIAILALQRRMDAAEELWRLLWIMETEGQLTASQHEAYVRTLIWMSDDIQRLAINVVSAPHGVDTSIKSQVEVLRSRLMTYAEKSRSDPRPPKEVIYDG
jgi:hypothetical protein